MKKQPIEDYVSKYGLYRSGSFPANKRKRLISFRREGKKVLSFPMLGFRIVRNKDKKEK